MYLVVCPVVFENLVDVCEQDSKRLSVERGAAFLMFHAGTYCDYLRLLRIELTFDCLELGSVYFMREVVRFVICRSELIGVRKR